MSSQNQQFVRLMKAAGIADPVIRTFQAYYDRLTSGERGFLPESSIRPPSESNLVSYEQISSMRSLSMLKKTVVIKLNGGLGTSMGLSKAKSLLPVKGNMNFLDVITRQVLALRASSGYDVQLLFMNSYNTDADTLAYLSKYPDLSRQDLPISFVQNKYPRIRQEDLAPFDRLTETRCGIHPGMGIYIPHLPPTGCWTN